MTGCPERLSGHRVVLDCSDLTVGTPSFLDEIIKVTLIEREADGLDVVHAADRVRVLLQRSAANRGVTDRLAVAVTLSGSNGTR